MSKWQCAMCDKKLKRKSELVDHLKEERDKYGWEHDQYETAEDQLYDLVGEEAFVDE